MPRTPRNKENKKVKIIEEVKEPEPVAEPETETEQAPKDDVKNDAYYYSKDKTPDAEPIVDQHPSPVAEHRNCLMHEKQSFSSHQPEQEQDIELEIPKKKTKTANRKATGTT